MKTNSLKSIALLIAVSVSCVVCGQQEKKPLTNADVIKMVKAGLAENVIITTIQSSPAGYDTSPTGLIDLKTQGVGAKVQEAMLAAQKPAPATPPNPMPVTTPATAAVLNSATVTLTDGAKRVPMQQALGEQRTGGWPVPKMELWFKTPKSLFRISTTTPAFEVQIPTGFRAEDVISLVQPKKQSKKERFVELAYAEPFGGLRPGKNPTVETTIEIVASPSPAGAGTATYVVRPKAPLKPGEYFVMIQKPDAPAMVAQSRAVFDFGVDVGK